jgi:hypothetical protein
MAINTAQNAIEESVIKDPKLYQINPVKLLARRVQIL